MKQLRTFIIGVVGGAVIVLGAAGWWLYYHKEKPSATSSNVQADIPEEQEKSWHVVQEFTGASVLKSQYTDEEQGNDDGYEPVQTESFAVSGGRVRITFENQFDDLVPKCIGGGPSILLYSVDDPKRYYQEISDSDCNGTVSQEFDGTFDMPKGSYYFKVFSVYDWKITVEEYK